MNEDEFIEFINIKYDNVISYIDNDKDKDSNDDENILLNKDKIEKIDKVMKPCRLECEHQDISKNIHSNSKFG